MNDSEILDQIGNLRVQLAQQVEGIAADDAPQLLMAVSIFIAGVDALFELRNSD